MNMASGFLRGTFEMAGDVIPLDEYWINGGQYAGGINPFIAKWNFTSPCKVAPYFAAVGGVLFSTHNLPPGDTAQVNFTSGPEIGVQIFRKDRTSWDLALKAYHLSNASHWQSQSRHQRVAAIHAGLYVVLELLGRPPF